MAEWLRRLTRNQMGYARAGSNPAACGKFFLRLNLKKKYIQKNYDRTDLEGIRLFLNFLVHFML